MVFGSADMQRRLKPLLPSQILGQRFEACESVQNLSYLTVTSHSKSRLVQLPGDVLVDSLIC